MHRYLKFDRGGDYNGRNPQFRTMYSIKGTALTIIIKSEKMVSNTNPVFLRRLAALICFSNCSMLLRCIRDAKLSLWGSG